MTQQNLDEENKKICDLSNSTQEVLERPKEICRRQHSTEHVCIFYLNNNSAIIL